MIFLKKKYVRLKKRFRCKISKHGAMNHLIDHPKKRGNNTKDVCFFFKKRSFGSGTPKAEMR